MDIEKLLKEFDKRAKEAFKKDGKEWYFKGSFGKKEKEPMAKKKPIIEYTDETRGITFKVGDRIRGRTGAELEKAYGRSGGRWRDVTYISHDEVEKDVFGKEYTIDYFREYNGHICVVSIEKEGFDKERLNGKWIVDIKAFDLVEQKEPEPDPSPLLWGQGREGEDNNKEYWEIESITDCLLIIAAQKNHCCKGLDCKSCICRFYETDKGSSCSDAMERAYEFLKEKGIDFEDKADFRDAKKILDLVRKENQSPFSPVEIKIGPPKDKTPAFTTCENCEFKKDLNGYTFCEHWHNFTNKDGHCSFGRPKTETERNDEND